MTTTYDYSDGALLAASNSRQQNVINADGAAVDIDTVVIEIYAVCINHAI